MKLGTRVDDPQKYLQERKEALKSLQADVAKLEVWATEISKFKQSEANGQAQVNQMAEELGQVLSEWPAAMMKKFALTPVHQLLLIYLL
jgi:recombinational DNA repair ATPase RecF